MAQFYDGKDKAYCIHVLQAGGRLNVKTSSHNVRSKEDQASYSPLEGVHVSNVPLTERERLFTLERALLGCDCSCLLRMASLSPNKIETPGALLNAI